MQSLQMRILELLQEHFHPALNAAYLFARCSVSFKKLPHKFGLSLHYLWGWAVRCYGSRRQRKMEDFAFVERRVPDLGAPLQRLIFPEFFFPHFTSHTNAGRQCCQPRLDEASNEANTPFSLRGFYRCMVVQMSRHTPSHWKLI